MNLDKNQKFMLLGGVLIIATTLIIPIVYNILLSSSMPNGQGPCNALSNVFVDLSFSLFNFISLCTGLIIGVTIVILSIFATQKRRKYITMLRFVKYLPFVVLLTIIFMYFAFPYLMSYFIFINGSISLPYQAISANGVPVSYLGGPSFWSYNQYNPYYCGPTTFASNSYVFSITLFMYIIAAVITFISSNKSIKQASKT